MRELNDGARPSQPWPRKLVVKTLGNQSAERDGIAMEASSTARSRAFSAEISMSGRTPTPSQLAPVIGLIARATEIVASRWG